MACDAETILEQACESQIGCLTSNIQLLIIIAQLLCEINEGGGGGGSGLFGVVDPNGVETADRGATYVNTATDSFWVKTANDGANTGWTALIV